MTLGFLKFKNEKMHPCESIINLTDLGRYAFRVVETSVRQLDQIIPMGIRLDCVDDKKPGTASIVVSSWFINGWFKKRIFKIAIWLLRKIGVDIYRTVVEHPPVHEQCRCQMESK